MKVVKATDDTSDGLAAGQIRTVEEHAVKRGELHVWRDAGLYSSKLARTHLLSTSRGAEHVRLACLTDEAGELVRGPHDCQKARYQPVRRDQRPHPSAVKLRRRLAREIPRPSIGRQRSPTDMASVYSHVSICAPRLRPSPQLQSSPARAISRMTSTVCCTPRPTIALISGRLIAAACSSDR